MKKMEPDGFTSVRRNGMSIYWREEEDIEPVIDALNTSGELLKHSRKHLTKRVGPWIIKTSQFERGTGPIKQTLLRAKYQRAWTAACRLYQHGVGVARPVAYIERSWLGVIWESTIVSQFLDGCLTVEDYARKLAARPANDEQVDEYLLGLARAILEIEMAGVYHHDLSGKNIFTKDGILFYFIDLDGVLLDRPYTDKLRLRNHIQLYDSFRDHWDDERLKRFICYLSKLDGDEATHWFNRVRREQVIRRARHMERLLRQQTP